MRKIYPASQPKTHLPLILALVFCLPQSLSAETIKLKSGKLIEGKIIEITQDYIKLEVNGIAVPYYLTELADKNDLSRLLNKYGPQDYGVSDDEAVNKSMQLHARGNPEQLDLSSQPLPLSPNSSRVYYNLLRQEERRGAPTVSDEALNKAMGYYVQKKIPEGIDASGSAIMANPSSPVAYINRQQNEERSGIHVASAEEILYRAMEYHARRKYPEEIDLLNRVIQLNPHLSRAYYKRAMAYYELRRYDKAREDLYMAELEGERVGLAFVKELSGTYRAVDPREAQGSLASALRREGLFLTDLESVTQRYYQDPKPDRLVAVIRAMTSLEWFVSDITTFAPFAHFVAAVAQDNPTLLLYLKNRQDVFSGSQKKAIARIIYEADNFRSPEPVSPQGIDYLWAEFFATGSVGPVRRIISALDSQRIDWQMAKYSAEWSLRANARQDAAIYKIIKKEQSRTSSKELKEYLGRILSKDYPIKDQG